MKLVIYSQKHFQVITFQYVHVDTSTRVAIYYKIPEFEKKYAMYTLV